MTDHNQTKSKWIDDYVAYTLKTCGFTHFDDGSPVESYAREVAESYWADQDFRADGPEVCADSDMDYWGET